MTKLKIGDFAKLAQISTHRVRNYEKQGLLQPHFIDKETGYRYYAVEQLGQLNRIIALRGLGLSLAAIKDALIANISVDQMEEMLLQHKDDIEQEIAERQYQLQQVHHRLQQIKNESRLAPYEIIIKPLPAYTVASIRMIVASRVDASYYCNALHYEIHEVLTKLGLIAESPTINLYHMSTYDEIDIDLEACVVVPSKALGINTYSRVQVRQLDAAPVAATLLFSGDYSQINSAIKYMEQWASREAYRPVGAFREVHHSPLVNQVKNHIGKPVVELQVPIEKFPKANF
ncbi:MAG: MerR family transcriptional regulator [Chloroflexota bacterium]